MMTTEKYLESLMPSKEEVAAFLEPVTGKALSRNGGNIYDPELGWVQAQAVVRDGVFGSKTFYRYELDGARRVVNGAQVPCRIHSYGDSFTHGDQVSDGETWQEYLAAHLQEPIRNYGVGGFSVYQAFLRMKRVQAATPVKNIILNIYDHDHFRNLISWWAINFGQRVRCGYTCPHLRINVRENRFTEMPNLLNTPESVYRLCDRDWVIENFRDDVILPSALAQRFPEWATWETAERVAENYGLSVETVRHLNPLDAIRQLAVDAALHSTMFVVQLMEKYAEANGKKLFVILSHGRGYLQDVLEGKPRWDQKFLDFVNKRRYPVVDMRDAFIDDHRATKLSADDYTRRHYNSHHSPSGNYFTAWTIREPVVDWLDPKPAPYTPTEEVVHLEHDGWAPTPQS